MTLIITGLLALIAIGVAFVLVQAFRQNRSLWREVQGASRPVPSLLRDTLVLWSPLALVIVVLAFAANRMAAGMVSLTYHLTTLDEFCEIEDLPGRIVIPCTGMRGVLARSAIKRAGALADLDQFLSAKYREARQAFLARSAEELAQAAANRGAFYRSLTPQGVLGLEQAPEDDFELVRLKKELRELLDTPTRPAANLLDIVRFVTERDARVPRMRVLTAMVIARREKINQAAYSGLPRDAQGRLWLRHRISHLLALGAVRPDAATDRALGQLLAEPATRERALATVQQGIVAMLARNEAVVADILARETKTRTGPAALYISLPMARQCTVAASDPALRLRAADFSDDGGGPLDPELITQSNSGSFPCFDTTGATQPLHLDSLGFAESVRRSIDRWHDDAVRDSFRRMGRLSLTSAAAAGDSKAAAREIARAVPTGVELGRSDCGLFRPGNCAANAANQALEAGYARARADIERRYERGADSVADAALLSFDQRIGQILVNLDAELDDMRAGAHAYAKRMFMLSYLLRVLGWLALALITIKSFLYVLALELFHSDEEMTIAFNGADPIEGEYRSARQLTIDRDFPHSLITREQLSNTDNNVCLAPWPWSSPLSRILHGRYFIFTKGAFLADADQPAGSTSAARGMVASASGGMSIIEWKMQPGEAVIFRYQDFYGASENVQLASEISFRLSTLLLGRVIFHSAHCTQGEGRLLLKANVEEITQEDIRAIPPERMIAWNRHAQFTIHSGRTPWKTLLNGYTLVRRARAHGPSGRIVVSSESAGSNLGSIRYLRRIFRAIF